MGQNPLQASPPIPVISTLEGNDYTPTTVVLTFIAGDGPGTTLNFSIPIVDDSLVEERENFNVELSSGEFSDTATFQITDNDGEFLDYVNYYPFKIGAI